MGTTTAVRSFALSGGAAGSLIGAVLVVLVVLGAILAFNGNDRSADGVGEQSVAIQGAPEAAAQAVAPATRAVAGSPVPVERSAPAAGAPQIFPRVSTVIVTEPPGRLPGANDEPADRDPADDGGPNPGPCVLGDVLPQCIDRPPIEPTPGGLLGAVAGDVDQAGNQLLGISLGVQQLSAPLGQALDDPVGGVKRVATGFGEALRNDAGARVAGGLGGTLRRVDGLVQGLAGNR